MVLSSIFLAHPKTHKLPIGITDQKHAKKLEDREKIKSTTSNVKTKITMIYVSFYCKRQHTFRCASSSAKMMQTYISCFDGAIMVHQKCWKITIRVVRNAICRDYFNKFCSWVSGSKFVKALRKYPTFRYSATNLQQESTQEQYIKHLKLEV